MGDAIAARVLESEEHQMSDEPPDIHDLLGLFAPDQAAKAVLELLLTAHPAIWTVDDLVRQVASAGGRRESARVVVLDGLSDLMGHGLAYQLDAFVIASPAAVRCAGLLG